MTSWILLAFGFCLLAGIFTYIVVPGNIHRAASVGLFAALSMLAFIVAFESLGNPKPVWAEWRPMEHLEIVGMVGSEKDKVLWVWVVRDNAPVAYRYPWPENMQDLQDKWRARRESGDRFYTGDNQVITERPPPQPSKDES